MLIQWPEKKKIGKIKGNNISSSDTRIRSMGINTGMQFFYFTLMPATNDLMQKKTLNSQVCTMNYIVNVRGFFLNLGSMGTCTKYNNSKDKNYVLSKIISPNKC